VSAVAQTAEALGWYVYGVVAADAAPPALSGVSGGVELVAAGSVAALVSRVDLAEFGEEPIRTRLEDPAWLERTARAHEEVLEEALAAGPVVPFRLLTVYADDADLRRFLVEHGSGLRAVLDRVRGKVELGVKAFVDREALDRAIARSSAAVAELDAEAAAAGAGRAYLLKQRRARLAQDESARVLASFSAGAHARLAAAAADAVANAVQPRELSGRSEQMILNGAYLVAPGDAGIASVVQEVQAEGAELGVAVELTGPWPPYNFVPRDLAAE
jgi:hypothetical protein